MIYIYIYIYKQKERKQTNHSNLGSIEEQAAPSPSIHPSRHHLTMASPLVFDTEKLRKFSAGRSNPNAWDAAKVSNISGVTDVDTITAIQNTSGGTGLTPWKVSQFKLLTKQTKEGATVSASWFMQTHQPVYKPQPKQKELQSLESLTRSHANVHAAPFFDIEGFEDIGGEAYVAWKAGEVVYATVNLYRALCGSDVDAKAKSRFTNAVNFVREDTLKNSCLQQAVKKALDETTDVNRKIWAKHIAVDLKEKQSIEPMDELVEGIRSWRELVRQVWADSGEHPGTTPHMYWNLDDSWCGEAFSSFATLGGYVGYHNVSDFFENDEGGGLKVKATHKDLFDEIDCFKWGLDYAANYLFAGIRPGPSQASTHKQQVLQSMKEGTLKVYVPERYKETKQVLVDTHTDWIDYLKDFKPVSYQIRKAGKKQIFEASPESDHPALTELREGHDTIFGNVDIFGDDADLFGIQGGPTEGGSYTCDMLASAMQ